MFHGRMCRMRTRVRSWGHKSVQNPGVDQM
jgi:hypothetical protein